MTARALAKTVLLLCLFSLLCLVPAQAAPTFLEDEAETNMDVSFVLSPADSGQFSLVFHYEDGQNFHVLDCASGSLALRRVSDGASHILAKSSVSRWQAPVKVTLQRRVWLLRVIADQKVLLTVYDTAPDGGKIGASASGGWRWSELRVQPVEAEIHFDDDFTRVPGHDGEWNNHSGTWLLTASSDEISASNQDMSANPFSYRVQEQEAPALTFTGRPFWDNYHAQVSVRPESSGEVGLAFYVQDPENYLLFIWSAQEGPDARRLVRVENGKPSVIAQKSGAFLPRQWYRLGVRTSPGKIEVLLDGESALQIPNNQFGQGGIGFYAKGTAANFDDVRVRSYPFFSMEFGNTGLGSWAAQGGEWRAGEAGVLRSAPVMGDRGATRMLTAGGSEWNDYEVTASGKTGEQGSCGVVVGFRDAANYTVFRWAGRQSTLPFKGRAQLLRYEDGRAQILSEVASPTPDSDGFTRIKVRFKNGALTVLQDGKIIAQAAGEAVKNGRMGLWVQGSEEVSFRDVQLSLPPEPEKQKVPPKMESDALMVGWASTVGEWPPRHSPDGVEFWNTGEFFGDAQLGYLWPIEEIEGSAIEWALRAESAEFASGYLLRMEGRRGRLELRLSQNGEALKEETLDLQKLEEMETDAATAKVTVELEGKAVLVSVGQIPVLSYLPDSEKAVPEGTRVALRGAAGYIASVKNLHAASANRDDYTFNEAPTDWYSLSGNWSIFARWPCYSDWSFFGGKGQSPILWSKRSYSGDVVLEMYVHPQMDLPKELGYSHPGDLNLTLCGDGKTASSGYSFVLAGWSNTRSAILKNSAVVAENYDKNARFERAFNQNSAFHRRWYYVRAEARRAVQDGKAGVRLRYFVDEKLLAEYFDEEPLETFENGRVAFWTVDGAMMIARAKIESQSPGARALPAKLLQLSSGSTSSESTSSKSTSERGKVGGNNDRDSKLLVPHPVLQDGVPSASVSELSGEKNRAFRITNRSGGGLFAVSLRRAVNDDGNSNSPTDNWLIDESARFEAELSLSPDARVDLYFTIDGKRHLVELNSRQRADARVEKLGAAVLSPEVLSEAKNSSIETWRKASFALGAALKTRYPEKQSWTVEKIEIGALHGDEYRLQGFSGNPFGADFFLRNGRLR